MNEAPKQLVGSVLERKPGPRASGSGTASSKPLSRFAQSQAAGFPAVQHRSQSAFARGRTENLERLVRPPGIVTPIPSTSSSTTQKPSENGVDASGDWRKEAVNDEDGWKKQMEEENAQRVEAMTEAERAQERLDILTRFGPGVGDILRKAREKREKENVKKLGINTGQVEKADEPDLVEVARRARSRSPPAPILSRAGSRASSPMPTRPSRRIRFSDAPTPVHVYESQPPSPKRRALALPAPTGDDEGVVSLGTFKGTLASHSANGHDNATTDPSSAASSGSTPPAPQDPEEGTPEDIRRRFFPHVSANDPALEWMSEFPPPTSTTSGSDEIRFDLTGTPIPPTLAQSLPTHLGLHHHADSAARAGYTLSDVLLLSRSTAPAQRGAMLSVLAKIVHRVGELHRAGAAEDGLKTLRGKEEDVRGRAVAAGAAALGPSGGVAARSVDVLWECIVSWDPDITDVRGIELRAPPAPESATNADKPMITDVLASLPLPPFFEQASSVFAAGALPSPTLLRLLAVVRRLSQQSSNSALTAARTPDLIHNILRALVFTSSGGGAQPAPEAIDALKVMAQMSRDAAWELRGAVDALLRFIVIPPPESAYPRPLADALLRSTLDFYAALASYGFGARVASTAQEPLGRIAGYVASPSAPNSVRVAYARAIERWIICAIDPHSTSPPHDIRWSQIVAWGWIDELKASGRAIADAGDDETWAALFDAYASYLEGARVNGERGGADERRDVVEGDEGIRAAYESGVAGDVVRRGVEALGKTLSGIEEEVGDGAILAQARMKEMAVKADVLAAAIRLWLSACPPDQQQEQPDADSLSPYQLPFADLRSLVLQVARSPILDTCHDFKSPVYAHVYGRHLSAFLAKYALAERRLVYLKSIVAGGPPLDEAAWFALALAVLPRLRSGDEDAARELVSHVLRCITPEFLTSKDLPAPPALWARGGPYNGMNVLKPFIVPDVVTIPNGQEDDEDSAGGGEPIVAPLSPTPRSIKAASAQVLPAPWTLTRRGPFAALPLHRDWPLLPLEHLLRSGVSPIFTPGGLPKDWDPNIGEPELVRASLLLARVARGALVSNGLSGLVMSRSEVVFGCMRVFMLEHGTKSGVPGEEGEGEGEVFRDEVVSRLMEELLAPYTLERSPIGLDVASVQSDSDKEGEEGPTIEMAAVRYLGTGTPFYQFYTDFVALYDALSLGHAAFGALLIPCLSQAYAADYRRLLYADHAQALSAIRTLPQQIPAARIGPFLWPAEKDAQVLGAQLGLLVGKSGRGKLSGVLRWLVVHHVSANIWPDLRFNGDGEGEGGEVERARKMLLAVVDQGGFEDVRDVCGYWQRREGDAVVPESCFDAANGDVRKGRLEWVRAWAGERVVARLEGLLSDPSA